MCVVVVDDEDDDDVTGWEANRSTYLKPPQIPKMQY
jgi:hypothetical protein